MLKDCSRRFVNNQGNIHYLLIGGCESGMLRVSDRLKSGHLFVLVGVFDFLMVFKVGSAKVCGVEFLSTGDTNGE